MEATGESHDSVRVDKIISTFFNAKTLADFESKLPSQKPIHDEELVVPKKIDVQQQPTHNQNNLRNKTIGLSYTINLVLPKTDDPAIFNAIFKSLKENLLND